MSTEEKTRFLEDYGDRRSVDDERSTRPRGERHRMLAVSVVLNLILLATTVILSIFLFRNAKASSVQELVSHKKGSELPEPYSPANVAIEYEYRSVVGNDSRFTGYPNQEYEDNMSKLMAGTLIRLSEEELELAGAESIPLKDGAYAGSIGVAHNLHCIKKIKQYIYPDYFMPGLDRDSKEMIRHRDHADHCLDWIRQGVMCYADPSMYTMYWENPINPTHKLPGVQKCVNWDRLHDWMKSRSTSIHDFVRQPIES